MAIVTPVDKDKLLNYLCNNCKTYEVETLELNELLKGSGVMYEHVEGILRQFEKQGLVSEVFIDYEDVIVKVHVDAHDLLLRGGFVVREELLEREIDKLKLEVEKLLKDLQPNYLEKGEKIISILSNVSSIASMWKK